MRLARKIIFPPNRTRHIVPIVILISFLRNSPKLSKLFRCNNLSVHTEYHYREFMTIIYILSRDQNNQQNIMCLSSHHLLIIRPPWLHDISHNSLSMIDYISMYHSVESAHSFQRICSNSSIPDYRKYPRPSRTDFEVH